VPLFPIFIVFFIGAVAETNRAPFDLAEAESELVSGFMTEHSASIFVFFFLAEYASIVLICILTSILFFGGYDFRFILYLGHYIGYIFDILYLIKSLFVNILGQGINISQIIHENNLFLSYFDAHYYLPSYLEGLLCSLSLGIKSVSMIFTFI
jgi:NADH-ubiquinone oxidoreductase chain 1